LLTEGNPRTPQVNLECQASQVNKINHVDLDEPRDQAFLSGQACLSC
jgi:hypothetical protein